MTQLPAQRDREVRPRPRRLDRRHCTAPMDVSPAAAGLRRGSRPGGALGALGTVGITGQERDEDASEYIKGVPKKVAAVVLLGLLGLAAGVAFGVLSSPAQAFYVETGLLLPAHSPHTASDLARMTRDDHPGVRVTAYGGRCQRCRWLKRHIGFSATGSTERAVHLAVREVIAANDGKVEQTWDALVYRVPRRGHGLVGYGLTGLLAGLGAALGFLVPPKSRPPCISSGANLAATYDFDQSVWKSFASTASVSSLNEPKPGQVGKITAWSSRRGGAHRCRLCSRGGRRQPGRAADNPYVAAGKNALSGACDWRWRGSA